jgi:hypothetical protein
VHLWAQLCRWVVVVVIVVVVVVLYPAQSGRR